MPLRTTINTAHSGRKAWVDLPILAAEHYNNNGELIAKVADIGWVKPTDYVLDATYGSGIWWRHFRPEELVPYRGDFTSMDCYEDEEFDLAAYDPPYMAPGGRATSGIRQMWDRYSMGLSDMTPQRNQQLINDGAHEVLCKIRYRGIMLMKCMSYISSGKYYDGVHETKKYLIGERGMVLLDEFIYIGGPGPQPQGRTRRCPVCNGEGGGWVQHGPELEDWEWEPCHNVCNDGRIPSEQQHARSNYSNLLVLRRI